MVLSRIYRERDLMVGNGYFFFPSLGVLWEVLGGLAATGRWADALFLEEELVVLGLVVWLAFSPPLTGRRPSPLRK